MAATKLLANSLRNIINDPVEGFAVELADESNLFEWKVYIEGPKDTLYEGGVFQLQMKFPPDFPMSPPELRFISDFWHPNVYKENGLVCISILHPPGEDVMSGESADERWLPTQSVTTILLSVISLLNAPNFSSPANVDASVEWRNDPVGFKRKCQRLVEKANREKPSEIVIPHPDTNREEREKQIEKMKAMNKPVEEDDFMDEPEEYDEASESEEESDLSDVDTKDGKEGKQEKAAEVKSSSKGEAHEQSESSHSDDSSNMKRAAKTKKKKKMENHQEKKKFADEDTESNTLSSNKEKRRGKKGKKCIIM